MVVLPSFAYVWVAENDVAPAPNVTVLVALSPQSTVAVKVSCIPGSVNVVVSVTVLCSTTVVGATLRLVIVGATLFTVTTSDPLTVPRSSSDTVTLIVTWSDEVPDGLSSAYTCVPEMLVTPAAALTVSVVPSPQATVRVCVSCTPASVNDTVAVMTLPSFTGVGEKVSPVSTGARLFTVIDVLAVPDPVSSSTTEILIEFRSLDVPVGLSSA